jgi:hypothetical protein
LDGDWVATAGPIINEILQGPKNLAEKEMIRQYIPGVHWLSAPDHPRNQQKALCGLPHEGYFLHKKRLSLHTTFLFKGSEGLNKDKLYVDEILKSVNCIPSFAKRGENPEKYSFQAPHRAISLTLQLPCRYTLINPRSVAFEPCSNC